MSKLVYQEHQNFFVSATVCSVNSFLSIVPFQINIDEEKIGKIRSVLENSTDSTFILFPEYTYSHELRDIYQEFSNRNGSVIIAGSGLEETDNGYYAYSPVFIPNQDTIKVYKKHITHAEILYSNGNIIPYPHEVQRQIRLNSGENIITFAVYVCYDFLIENKSERSDIIFVPQYEGSPQNFINEADRLSKGHKNFILGSNNADAGQRSLGFAVLNTQLIHILFEKSWRSERYGDQDGNRLDFDHTAFYDVHGEKLLKFRLNLGHPYSLQFNFDFHGAQPVIIPLTKLDL